MTVPTLRRGARVQTTGEGRTQRWPGWKGTVTSVRNGRIYIRMDAVRFTEEEYEPYEIRLLDTARPGCPCAQCNHS